VIKAATGLFTLIVLLGGAWTAGPAEAVISPSPLDCSIVGSSCTSLSGVGQLLFSSPGNGTLIVTYNAPAGFKIVGGDQFALNFSSAVTGTLRVSLTINGGLPATTTALIAPQAIASCSPCFNFLLGPSFVDENASTGATYVFTITGDPDLSLATVVPGGALNLDAELHLNTGGPQGVSVFAAETGQTSVPEAVPEAGTLTLLGTGLVGVALWARRKSSRFFER